MKELPAAFKASRKVSGSLRLLPVLAILSLLLQTANADTDFSYRVTRLENRLLVNFTQPLAFDQILLPTCNDELWGPGTICRAALIEAADQQFIASARANEGFMVFRPKTTASSSFYITPLITRAAELENHGQNADNRIELTAVPAEVRAIENRIRHLVDATMQFNRENRCFSCHTALPLALAVKTAAARGYELDQNMLQTVGNEIARLQLADGSFFFPEQPAYGRIMTTMCAGAILSMLAEFNPELHTNLKNMLPVLKNWRNPDGTPGSDFFFRPVFIGQPTALLFESILTSSVYFRAFAESDGAPDAQLGKRLSELSGWAKDLKNEAIHRRIIIMAGMPLTFQFQETERPELIRELTRVIYNEPEGKRRDIRALAVWLLNRINPTNQLPLPAFPAPQNLADQIWECFEQIIQTRPGQKKSS
ncbi:MAG TPA: hypothetical protein PLK58_04970 [Candidatus Rifleibacterium sp.]|nr:hypothetical protein [Candidatus Rifleibacterium sp.]